MTVHPTMLRAVTHLDVGDEDIERAIELIPRALGALPAPERYRRLVLERAARRARCRSVSAAVFRGGELAWSDAVGLADVEQGVEATPDTQYAVALDHEDVHRRRRSCSCATRASSTSTTRSRAAPARGRARDADAAPDARARLRPAARAAGRDLGDAHRSPTRRSCCAALQRGRAGAAADGGVALLEPRLRAARRSSSRGSRARRSATTSRSGCSARSGSTRTTWGPGDGAALPYFVEPYSDVGAARARARARRQGRRVGLCSTVGDLARWGAFLCDPDEAVLDARVGRRRCTTCTMMADAELDARLGPRDRALATRRADLRRAHRRLPGLPLDPRLLAPRPDRGGRADERAAAGRS